MLIKEKKLRQIINKILKESIFGPEDRDPAPFPGEDEPKRRNLFFGYDVENKTNFVFKRRQILAYAEKYALELAKVSKGIRLSQEELDRIDNFRKNFAGLIIEMHVDSIKYPENKITETLRAIKEVLREKADLNLGLKEFLSLILTKEIIDEILELEKHLIPPVFIRHIRNDAEYLQVASQQDIDTIADYYQATERNKQTIRKRVTFDQRIRPDARWPDFVKYYDLNDIDNAYKVLKNIMKNLLAMPYGKFASARTNILKRLSRKLGFFVEEEIRERRKGERHSYYQSRIEKIKQTNKKKSLLGLKQSRQWLRDNLEDQELVEEFLSRRN